MGVRVPSGGSRIEQAFLFGQMGRQYSTVL